MTAAARYAHRVAHRLCVQCAAGLQEADGVRCIECAELLRADPGKPARDARHARTPGRREKNAARMARHYAANVKAGKCGDCGDPSGRFKRCVTCRRIRATYNASYRARLRGKSRAA